MKEEERIVRNQTVQGAIWSTDDMVDELVNRWDKTQKLKCHEQELQLAIKDVSIIIYTLCI